MDSPKTLLEAVEYFSDELRCIHAVAMMKWGSNGPHCPDCLGNDGKEPYWIGSQKRWKCRTCRRQFSVKVETIFEDSPIPLSKWLPALWMLTNCKNGVSSWEIHRALGVTQKTAWFMLHRLRLAMHCPDNGSKLGSNEGDEVEVDEAFIGGKAKFMHKKRRVELQKIRSGISDIEARGKVGKTAVQGFLDREARQVRATVVSDTRRDTLQTLVLKNVKYGSRVYTDSAVMYDKLHLRYVHEVVNHIECYVKGQVHTNGLENFWSLLKRGLKGTYVAVEPYHLARYVDEQVFRYNNRATKDNPLNDSDRFLLALSQVANKRLTYKELTGKDGATSF